MRIFTSAPVESAFMWRKSWQHPSRREYIHGKIHAQDCSCKLCKVAV
jgi:hypothetical protein